MQTNRDFLNTKKGSDFAEQISKIVFEMWFLATCIRLARSTFCGDEVDGSTRVPEGQQTSDVRTSLAE